MVKKISRRKCIELYSQLAHIEESNIFDGDNSFYPKACASFALTYKANSFMEHASVLAQELTQMIREFGYTYCLFLPNEDKAWIQDPGDKKVLMDAVDFLFECGVEEGFNGGLHVQVELLEPFVKQVMVMSHYSDKFPCINFTDGTRHFLSSICSHGNIHVDMLNTDCLQLALDAIEKSKLNLIKTEMCELIYSDVQPIKSNKTYYSVF